MYSSLLPLVALTSTAFALPAPARLYHSQEQCVLSLDPLRSPNGTRGAVASESRICSQIGIDMISAGGTAADALVATTLCVGVIGMYHSGIGGGGFMLVRDELGRYEVIDYRETAPASAHRDMYKHDRNASVIGGLAVGVPGEMRGLGYLQQKYGRLRWKEVVMPAVEVAREGFAVGEDLVRYMKAASVKDDFLVRDPVWAEDFAPNGTLLGLGDWITRKRLATTLEKIANEGPDAFYEGEIAESIIKTIQETNGTMTLEDLREYAVRLKQPLSIEYRDFKLFTTDAPSSGAVTLNILKVMEQFPPEDLADKNLTAHRLTEAMKFAYGARQELGDPDFIRGLTSFQKTMISEEKAQQVRKMILDNQTQALEVYNPRSVYAAESFGTSHLVASDGTGMTVTSTTTINLLFGARIMTDTGIILNNEMDDFSQPGRPNSFGFEPSPNNFIAPYKRPLSSITPLIAEHATNGSLFFATGAAGGSRIISSTMQVAFKIMSAIDQGHTPVGEMYEAIKAPRLHHQLMPNVLNVEIGYDESVFASLGSKQHNVSWIAPGQSAAQGLLRLYNGTFQAVGETRQLNSGGLTV
ncbi:gamma-glutamyltranspeptidase [Triangularia verruculosa]|uniref:Glutathione hydrolase n=1 Tax=Triangularia verruculosa TaxID=2587418 RepID=A0AAN6XF92_9PEZI|nr:gamma-glutamyltranspeptidase [Triangularia verruculosa]